MLSSPLPSFARELGYYNEVGGERASAAIVILSRNKELDDVIHTLRTFEPVFNAKYRYPYVFLNDKKWDPSFKRKVAAFLSAVRGENISESDDRYLRFGLIEKEHWSWPTSVNEKRARAHMALDAKNGVPYADMDSYHHMCRYQSGFFFKHELLKDFKYYWRVEPDVDYYCPLSYDPLLYMQKTNKKYGFNIVAPEFMATVPSLGKTVKAYMADQNITSIPDTLSLMWDMTADDYNGLHFWSNFEIASLDWFRSDEYTKLFNYLDATGNFYYERWGDAPVHSVAAGVLLKPDELHYFEDIGYRHGDRVHCPAVREREGVYGPCACNLERLKKTWVKWGIWAYSDSWMEMLKKWNAWAVVHQSGESTLGPDNGPTDQAGP
ncbi:glycolipid 2-alpha-mannosyltransferase-domain-containing protein [Fimicolochytrium jonesii]|uniref:glycolipid 2-alpha-mannosyltransferase-domain-containing protein n=1 Tax=Fimicolochytrium jonesii TaxID=1396493 RepID=UPI0022FE366F|nr:glycolipid 2-alpha-mannosyltransferase-domain-containing protein [Fimicolochytrium jonesii]KAI8819331.1 glycolipid 2-alpha-mannosyltransferase-domain-containing protein [Fimicolochytrium jonesii]